MLERHLDNLASHCQSRGGKGLERSRFRTYRLSECLADIVRLEPLFPGHVDVIDVTAGARAEQTNELPAVCLTKGLFQIVRIIRRIHGPADGIQMEGEVHHRRTNNRVIGLAEEYHSNLGIDGTGRSNDIGIQDPGVKSDRPVSHVKAAIERQTLLLGRSGFETDGLGMRVGFSYSLNDFRNQLGRVIHFFTCIVTMLSYGHVVEVFPQGAEVQRSGVRVCGGNEDIRGWNAGLRRGLLARPRSDIE